MEDLKQIQEFFSKPLEENKVTKEDFNKVVKVLSASKYPFTIMLVPKWDEIDIITGQDSPDEIVDDISQRLDSAGLNWGGNSGITISGDSSNYSRREYSDIFRVNGGHKDYFEESYASSFGGFRKELDGETIENELQAKGYETPRTGIWNKILVNKNGERVAMIDTDESSYTKDGKSYQWKGISNFINHVESLNEGASTEEKRMAMQAIKRFAKYRGVSEKEAKADLIRAVKELGSIEEAINEIVETIQLGKQLDEKKLCKKGQAYRKRRMAAGEKSSAYLSGRAVKVCKGQISGRKKRKKKRRKKK